MENNEIPRGLTTPEKKVLELLVDTWNAFLSLKEMHPSERPDFQDAIHSAQRIIMSREVFRSNPEMFEITNTEPIVDFNEMAAMFKEVDKRRMEEQILFEHIGRLDRFLLKANNDRNQGLLKSSIDRLVVPYKFEDKRVFLQAIRTIDTFDWDRETILLIRAYLPGFIPANHWRYLPYYPTYQSS